MPCACIDVGSNTTRLLVAEPAEGGLRELAARRHFTRIGKSLAGGTLIPESKIAETAEVVAAQARAARDRGAEQIIVVATAAIREASNRDQLVAAVAAATGLTMNVLSSADEARLSFAGASRAVGAGAGRTLAVVDVGGGSTEVAIGTAAGGVSWSDSYRVGSGLLADRHLRSDPPTTGELHALRDHVTDAFESLEVPACDLAVAVGGSATSLRRFAGGELGGDALERSIGILCGSSVAEVARRFELDPQRVRLLPAGIVILAEVSSRLGLPLTIADGGLREGALLELIEQGAAG